MKFASLRAPKYLLTAGTQAFSSLTLYIATCFNNYEEHVFKKSITVTHIAACCLLEIPRYIARFTGIFLSFVYSCKLLCNYG